MLRVWIVLCQLLCIVMFGFNFKSNDSYLDQFLSRRISNWCTIIKSAADQMVESWNNNAKVKQHFQLAYSILQRSTIFRRSSDLYNRVYLCTYVVCIIECRNVAIFEKKWAFQIIIFIILVGTRGAQLSFFSPSQPLLLLPPPYNFHNDLITSTVPCRVLPSWLKFPFVNVSCSCISSWASRAAVKCSKLDYHHHGGGVEGDPRRHVPF